MQAEMLVLFLKMRKTSGLFLCNVLCISRNNQSGSGFLCDAIVSFYP